MRLLTEAECREAIKRGAFSLPEIAGTAAIVLTQSWCPQWKALKSYLPDAEKRLNGLTVLYVEYDLAPFYEDFMAFKESTFNNREIPYVLYYKDGKLVSESNYVSLEGFLRRFA
jgi:hypothetical protein